MSEFPQFDAYVGVDWSGARGPRLPGLQVAVAMPGEEAPELVYCPDGHPAWTRTAFLDWLLDFASAGRRVLCGLDFAFTLPYADISDYLPDGVIEARDGPSLWREVDALCDDESLYGGEFAAQEGLSRYFRWPGFKGSAYHPRLRAAEERCRDQGLGRAESAFNLIGASQVGKSALAGMRFLHALKQSRPEAAVWTFDDWENADLVIVEAFPRAFIRHADHVGSYEKVQNRDTFAAILSTFQSESPGFAGLSDHAADAIISAAALRDLSARDGIWKPDCLDCETARTEGWIFGIN